MHKSVSYSRFVILDNFRCLNVFKHCLILIAKRSAKRSERSKRSIRKATPSALQSIDIRSLIELSFQYGDLENKKIFSIIKNLLEFSDVSFDWKMTLYPMFVYKIAIHYEELSIFETMFANEVHANSIDAARIISDWFIYSVGIDKINVAAYLWIRFSTLLFKLKEATWSGLLQIFEEYFSSQHNIWKLVGIWGFEEKLYFIEVWLNYFSSELAKQLIQLFK